MRRALRLEPEQGVRHDRAASNDKARPQGKREARLVMAEVAEPEYIVYPGNRLTGCGVRAKSHPRHALIVVSLKIL